MKKLNVIRKVLASVALSTLVGLTLNAIFVTKSYAELVVHAMEIDGVLHYAGFPKTTSIQQKTFLSEIKKGKELDNYFAKRYVEEKNLIPFKDLFEDYGQVFKNNDKFLKEIYRDKNYNTNILDAYIDYRTNMINNFRNNLILAKERGIGEEMELKIQAMLKKLENQNKKELKMLKIYYSFAK